MHGPDQGPGPPRRQPLPPCPLQGRALRLLVGFALGATLAGCDLFSPVPTSDNLAHGTYTLNVDGRSFSGTARFYPERSVPGDLPVVLLPPSGPHIFSLTAEQFVSAGNGSSFEPPGARFRSPSGALFVYSSGTVTIHAAQPDGLRGTFSLRMEDIAVGPGSGGSTTARGAFYALTSEVGQC